MISFWAKKFFYKRSINAKKRAIIDAEKHVLNRSIIQLERDTTSEKVQCIKDNLFSPLYYVKISNIVC